MKRLNHFGFLPANPDNNLNSSVYGEGTDYPVGFSFSEVFKMYWTVRSFNCSIAGITDEWLGGGSITSILEAIGAVQSANNGLNNSQDVLSGYTKISDNFIQKLRKGKRDLSKPEEDIYTFEGIKNSETQKQISATSTKELKSIQSSVFEETLFSLGPVHVLPASSGLNNSGIIINFSETKFAKNLYWPKISINSKNFSSSIKSSLKEAIGGVNFNGSIIKMYYVGNSYSVTPIINGSITIGQRCCDRFLYDAFDQERREKKECSGWEQIPEFKV
jgi:hypothetical protein